MAISESPPKKVGVGIRKSLPIAVLAGGRRLRLAQPSEVRPYEKTMIPIRLELKNFMSYGENVMPLDFSGMHLACLSGDNGNGKSALLDAMTWALWGEARASADELIRLGTDEMRVVFDFQLGDDLYRVIRGRSKRNNSSLWELYIADGAGEFKPITGHGIRDTGRLIERILRMDYKTFINSAYIQQGRADEFTKQAVADRKKILADILDLSRYDVLEQKAKERRNEAEQHVQELGRDIGQIEVELANEDGYKTQFAASKSERDAVESQIAEVEGRLRELQSRQAELETTARRIEELKQSVSSRQSEIENLLAQKAEQERRVAGSREILKDRERILKGLEKLRSTRELVGLFDKRLEELRTLEHEKSGLDQQILMEKHRIELERESLAKEHSELEGKIGGASRIEKDIESLRGKIVELDKLDDQRKNLQIKVDKQSDRLGVLKAEHDLLRNSIKPDLEEKLKLISDTEAKCPLCQTELDVEKHRAIIADYRFEIERTDVHIRNLKRQGIKVKAERNAAQQEIVGIEEQLKAGLEVRRQLAQDEQVLFQTEEYKKQLSDVQARLDKAVEKLNSGEFAREAIGKLKAVDSKIAALEYNTDEHLRVKEEFAGLKEFESLAVGLQHAEESLPADESNLKAVVELIAVREKSITESEQSMKELSESAEEHVAVSSELSAVSASLQLLRETDRQITGRIATLEHSLERCKSLRAEVSDRRKELEKAKKDKMAYTELVAAFGKKGVQALIIENAVPEIQEEANKLLARMTDNALQVSIETVRDKKTGGVAETLDIKISDDMGTRSYELYSGGEAFRVNFALRIALSKLLARRAGARLQTLIIDEGFGTQDGKGREKLVEAINSIQDDFEKILVITHIDELKDAFPTRIEITKDSQGSQISVN